MTWIDKNKSSRRRVDTVEPLYIQIAQTEIQILNTAIFIAFSSDSGPLPKLTPSKKFPKFQNYRHRFDDVDKGKEKFLHVKKQYCRKYWSNSCSVLLLQLPDWMNVFPFAKLKQAVCFQRSNSISQFS